MSSQKEVSDKGELNQCQDPRPTQSTKQASFAASQKPTKARRLPAPAPELPTEQTYLPNLPGGEVPHFNETIHRASDQILAVRWKPSTLHVGLLPKLFYTRTEIKPDKLPKWQQAIHIKRKSQPPFGHKFQCCLEMCSHIPNIKVQGLFVFIYSPGTGCYA